MKTETVIILIAVGVTIYLFSTVSSIASDVDDSIDTAIQSVSDIGTEALSLPETVWNWFFGTTTGSGT